MNKLISKFLDILSNYFAHRKGLLPVIGIFCVVLNFLLQFSHLPDLITQTNLFLHLGIIITIIGFLLSWAL